MINLPSTLLLDVDGPLTEGFFQTVVAAACDLGYDVNEDMITEWDIFRSLGVVGQDQNEIRQRLQRDGACFSWPVRTGAIEFLRWARDRFTVYAVTAPLDDSPTWTYDREKWLETRLGFAPSNIIHARDKRLIRGDVFVDDKVEHLRTWAEYNRAGTPILWGMKHNAGGGWVGHTVEDFDRLKKAIIGAGWTR